jgi:hypothetical protein
MWNMYQEFLQGRCPIKVTALHKQLVEGIHLAITFKAFKFWQWVMSLEGGCSSYLQGGRSGARSILSRIMTKDAKIKAIWQTYYTTFSSQQEVAQLEEI